VVDGEIQEEGFRHLFTPRTHRLPADLLPALKHDMADAADEPSSNSTAEGLDMGTPAKVLVHHDHLVGVFLRFLIHSPRPRHVHGQRLFTKDMQACPQGSDVASGCKI